LHVTTPRRCIRAGTMKNFDKRVVYHSRLMAAHSDAWRSHRGSLRQTHPVPVDNWVEVWGFALVLLTASH
jgi:hypothetical protein